MSGPDAQKEVFIEKTKKTSIKRYFINSFAFICLNLSES